MLDSAVIVAVVIGSDCSGAGGVGGGGGVGAVVFIGGGGVCAVVVLIAGVSRYVGDGAYILSDYNRVRKHSCRLIWSE